jgi:EAL domain-containing protein (putative c-di-GMP-specific phosphodiesterase class I)
MPGHLPAQRLIIEITESTAVGGGATADTLAALRALGIRVALDDFGTGQSTLSLLAACPIDQIKLDRSFLPDEHFSVIAAAVLQLARGLGLDTVAEGVETPAQARRFRTLGYQQAQGYHFARPMPASRSLTGGGAGRWSTLVLPSAGRLPIALRAVLGGTRRTCGAREFGRPR